jgi:hypothetical protein
MKETESIPMNPYDDRVIATNKDLPIAKDKKMSFNTS